MGVLNSEHVFFGVGNWMALQFSDWSHREFLRFASLRLFLFPSRHIRVCTLWEHKYSIELFATLAVNL